MESSVPGILSAICVIVGILLLRVFFNVLPVLGGCLLRWKECVKSEDSVKTGIDRNIMAIYLVLPFCLVAAKYRLYPADFMQELSDTACLGAVTGIFIMYVLFRLLFFSLVRPSGMDRKTYLASHRAAWSFFCIMALAVLCTAGFCSFIKVPDDCVTRILLYVMAGIYAVFLVRRFQIFSNSCSILTAILYLCALEILPSAIFVVPAIFF